MEYPTDLLYSETHEWLRVEKKSDGKTYATLGVTAYAQSQLGDVVLVELPNEGLEVKKGDSFGVVESVKTVSDLYVPFSGRVVEKNSALLENPERVNEDPYGEGWIARFELKNPEELTPLLKADRYREMVEEEQA